MRKRLTKNRSAAHVWVRLYDGRSINKLQNGVILSIFRLWKFRNIHFVGNLILSTSCEFYNDDVTVTSFINIGYGTLPLKSSHKEQPSVIRLLWEKRLSANAFQSEMCPVYGDKYFTRPTIHVCCKSLLMVENERHTGRVSRLSPDRNKRSINCASYSTRELKTARGHVMPPPQLLMRNDLVAVLFRRPMQRSQRSIPSCGKIAACDGINVYNMNLDDTLKSKPLTFDV